MTILIVAEKRFLALCLGLVFLLPSSGLFLPAGTELVSASPDRLKWSVVDTPSEEGYIVVSPSEVNAFVLGSDEVFYAINIPGKKVYKSTDSGVTWEDDLTEALSDEGANLPAWDIAVAPGDPELVAVVTNNRQEVYLSEDGGDSWTNVHVSDAPGWNATLLISDIAISTEYDGNRYIAIGTRNPDVSANGNVWVLELRPFPSWEPTELNMDVSSVAFSSGYGEDGVILAIASDTTGTYLCTRHKPGDEWEDVIPPVEIKEAESSPKKDEIIVSDLALPSADYAKDADWIVYAAYYSTTEADDAYRIEHEADEEVAEVTRLDIDDGDKVSLASIDYGDGKLLVGEVLGEESSASALIHICSNPKERFPEWEEPTEPPTGGAFSGRANAQVAWSSGGRIVYCGTSTNNVTSAGSWADTSLPGAWSGNTVDKPDESSFSVSRDRGDTWNQLSLIDTQMDHLCDYALSADYETLYLASAGKLSEGIRFDSLWRSTSDALGETWQRVFCFDSEGKEIILRSTPEGSPKEVIFFAVIDTNDARYSLDKGETWKSVWQCPHITDLAIVDNELLYILDDNLVNKGTWDKKRDIREWEIDIDTELLSGYSIAVSGEDYVFVAEDEDGEGKVAYSTDGGATFELTEAVPEPGNMQVIPDDEFDSNRFIYAASDGDKGKIYRWTIEGSISWRELNPPHLGFNGLAQKGGALYGAYGPGVARTLIPHEETVTKDDWDSLEAGLEDYDVEFRPSALRAISNEAIDLWAIDDHGYDFEANAGCLWVYSDAFVLRTPWPTSPAIGELIPCDVCACQARIFCFSWRELPSAEQYELWVALDEEFNYVIAKVQNITPADPHSPGWCSREGPLRFVCGRTYYWKVRSCTVTEGETVHSRWSPPMRFTVETCSSMGGMHIAPILKVPKGGSRDVPRSPAFSWIGFPHTTKYEFILAANADLTQVIVREEVPASAYIYRGELDWGKTYFWQVKAIEPAPSEPAIAAFTVMLEPQPTTPPITPTAPTPVIPATPFWVWVIIGILALLVMVVIVLCLVTRPRK